MTTITHGVTTITPRQITGYRHEREHGNRIYDTLNTADPAVVFDPAGLRKGTLQILCVDAAQAFQLDDLHSEVGVFVLDDDDVAGVGMTYVPDGSIVVELQNDNGFWNWAVEVDFQEVAT